MAAAAPQFGFPSAAQFQLPAGINPAVCPNFPFCSNNLPAARAAQPAQAAAATNTGALSGLLRNAQQLASNPSVPAPIRAQINSILATARQPNTGAVLPQIQSQLNGLLSQGQTQTQNLPPQLRSQIDGLVSAAQQIVPQAQVRAPAAPAAPAQAPTAAPSNAFTGLVGPSGVVGPSGLVGPAGPLAFGRKK